LQVSLKKHEINKLNLYHIAKLLNSLLIIELKFSINILLELNLITTLSSFIYNPLMFDILINLISPNSSKFLIDENMQVEIWKNCLSENIFVELSKVMIRGVEFMKKKTSVLSFSFEKFVLKYEKNKKNLLSVEESEKLSLDKIFGKNKFLGNSAVIFVFNYSFFFN